MVSQLHCRSSRFGHNKLNERSFIIIGNGSIQVMLKTKTLLLREPAANVNTRNGVRIKKNQN